MEQVEIGQLDIVELRARIERSNARELDLQEKTYQARESETFYRTEASQYEEMNVKLTEKVRKLKLKLKIAADAQISEKSIQTEEDVQSTIDELKSQVNSLKKKTLSLQQEAEKLSKEPSFCSEDPN